LKFTEVASIGEARGIAVQLNHVPSGLAQTERQLRLALSRPLRHENHAAIAPDDICRAPSPARCEHARRHRQTPHRVDHGEQFERSGAIASRQVLDRLREHSKTSLTLWLKILPAPRCPPNRMIASEIG
jgi:hypothetical protein